MDKPILPTIALIGIVNLTLFSQGNFQLKCQKNNLIRDTRCFQNTYSLSFTVSYVKSSFTDLSFKKKDDLWLLVGPCLPIRNVWLFSVLQSHFQLGRTDVGPHHRGKVLSQQHCALSWAATHIHCQLKGTTFLTKYFTLYDIAVKLVLVPFLIN